MVSMDKPTTKKRTNLHLDPALWRGLRVRAIEEGTTATDLINRVIGAYLAAPSQKPGRSKTAKKGA